MRSDYDCDFRFFTPAMSIMCTHSEAVASASQDIDCLGMVSAELVVAITTNEVSP